MASLSSEHEKCKLLTGCEFWNSHNGVA